MLPQPAAAEVAAAGMVAEVPTYVEVEVEAVIRLDSKAAIPHGLIFSAIWLGMT